MNKLFTATWCGPCKIVKAELDKLQHNVELIDVDTDSASVTAYGVRGVPSLVLGDGRVVVGAERIVKELRERYGKAE